MGSRVAEAALSGHLLCSFMQRGSTMAESLRDAVAVTDLCSGRELRFFEVVQGGVAACRGVRPTLIKGFALLIGRIPRATSQPACAKWEERANLPRSLALGSSCFQRSPFYLNPDQTWMHLRRERSGCSFFNCSPG
jgi:hypothetical protein